MKQIKLRWPKKPPKSFSGTVLYDNGNTATYKDGEIHNDVLPALTFHNGTTFWYFNGQCHRIGGPAVVFNNGEKRWFLNGQGYPKEEYWNRCWQYYGSDPKYKKIIISYRLGKE